jgi:hypothetical protein
VCEENLHSQPPTDTQSPSQQRTGPKRRDKVYCDKWIHEGTCAFAQQGCKYLHKMPMDRATQYSLGLFQGLPPWWKRYQAELAKPRPAAPGAAAAAAAPVSALATDAPLALPSRPAGGGRRGGGLTLGQPLPQAAGAAAATSPGPAVVPRYAGPWRRGDAGTGVSALPSPTTPPGAGGGSRYVNQAPPLCEFPHIPLCRRAGRR